MGRHASTSRPTAPTTAAGGAAPGGDAAFYVGESEAVARRLAEHHRTHKGCRIDCVLVEVASRTEALRVEAATLQRLKEELRGEALVKNVARA